MPKPADHQLDLLLLSEKPLWPLDQGFKVHGYHTATAARALGARVGMACMAPTPADAPEALRDLLLDWPEPAPGEVDSFADGWGKTRRPLLFRARCRLADHQGLEMNELAGATALVERHRPRAIVGVGLHSMLMLAGLGPAAQRCGAARIWYAADELVYFDLSCMMRESVVSLPARLHALALHALLENCFARGLEGAIGVSPRDARLLRTIGGARHTITLRNGVDLDHYCPAESGTASGACLQAQSAVSSTSGNSPAGQDTADSAVGTAPLAVPLRTAEVGAPTPPHSLAFWGRLDFEPNVDAVCWFARHVWPQLRALHPDATWHIAGKRPAPVVRDLGRLPGVVVLGQVADVRSVARTAALTILPMRCGGGIKNKLLEAAAMGRPIVASPRAVAGLQMPNGAPAWRACRRAKDWVKTIDELWRDPDAARQLGEGARAWVAANHHWSDVASGLLAWIDRGLASPVSRGACPASLETPGDAAPVANS